jgi:K+-transporting ATPase ATPase C chain
METKKELLIALRMTAVTLVLTGIAYPLAITAGAQLLFRWRANGSLLDKNGAHIGPGEALVGSELIAQPFKGVQYVQPRPSAAGDGYNATNSSGSNWGATSKKLLDRVQGDLDRLRAENPEAPGPVPIELITASGSGLDPHLSPEAATWQVPRIAAARNRSRSEVAAVIEAHVEARALGLLGEPRVNVLLVNLDLDQRFGKRQEKGASQ